MGRRDIRSGGRDSGLQPIITGKEGFGYRPRPASVFRRPPTLPARASVAERALPFPAENSCMVTGAMPIALPEQQTSTNTRVASLWNVVLLNDDDHSYDYVIEMLGRLFGTDAETAFLRACELDNTDRVIVATTSKERAELKQEQIHAYGPDPRLPKCVGSMSAQIEPAV